MYLNTRAFCVIINDGRIFTNGGFQMTSSLQPTGEFVSARHKHLEWKAINGMHMDKCYCGCHRDDKAELARYRQAIERADEVLLSPYERLTQQFDQLSAMEREKLLDQFSSQSQKGG